MVFQHSAQRAVECTKSDGVDFAVSIGQSQAQVVFSGAFGEGNAGNITFDSSGTVINASEVLASATEGNGGNIRIRSNAYLESVDSNVIATSDKGIDGIVDAPPPDTALRAGLTRLPEDLLDVSAMLAQPCAARAQGRGSFVVRPRIGPADTPDRPLIAPIPLPEPQGGVRHDGPSPEGESSARPDEPRAIASGEASPFDWPVHANCRAGDDRDPAPGTTGIVR